MKIESKKDGTLVTIVLENESEQQQLVHALTAVAISSARSPQYRDGWRRKGALGNAFQAKDKVNRVWDMARLDSHFDPDDAYDVINYLIFAIRAQEEHNNGGEFWPEKDQRTASPLTGSGQDRDSQRVTTPGAPNGSGQPQGDEVRQPSSP